MSSWHKGFFAALLSEKAQKALAYPIVTPKIMQYMKNGQFNPTVLFLSFDSEH